MARTRTIVKGEAKQATSSSIIGFIGARPRILTHKHLLPKIISEIYN